MSEMSVLAGLKEDESGAEGISCCPHNRWGSVRSGRANTVISSSRRSKLQKHLAHYIDSEP